MSGNKKIDGLPVAATLTGTEPTVIVQGGVTVQTTVQNIADLGTPQSLQDVTDIGATTTKAIATRGYSASDTIGNEIARIDEEYLFVAKSDLSKNLLEVDRVNNTVKVDTLFSEVKSIDIAGDTTIDLSTATGNLIHITGSGWTCTSLGTVQSGTTVKLVFDGVGVLTYNATSLILQGYADITTAANDIAIFASDGTGNWRCISYTSYNDDYTPYATAFTGFSVAPTVPSGYCRYKMITRNTCHFILYPSVIGTSNATTMTVTLPFAASSTQVQLFNILVYNNGSAVNGTIRTRVGSNIADVYVGGFSAFTAGGGKSAMCTILYETDL